MKKIFIFALILVMLIAVMPCCADDLSVQAVGEGATPRQIEPMRFDDVTFGKPYKINGYATVTLLGFKFVNMFAQWDDGKASSGLDNYAYKDIFVYAQKPKDESNAYPAYIDCSFKGSGTEADFAWLKVDVQNLQKTDYGFIKDIKIKVIYDDEYEYKGWVRQFNYDYSKSEIYSRNKNIGIIGWPVCLSPVDELAISPMYKGHYVFGCTLPNFIVEDKKSPLRMIINLGENELVYNIRK